MTVAGDETVVCPACGGGMCAEPRISGGCGCCHGKGAVTRATADWWGAEMVRDGFAVRRTCPECPWRLDVPTGRFPPERFLALKRSCQQGFGNSVFACHKSRFGKERACAGFLLVEGGNNLEVRVAMIRGELNPAELSAAGPLYSSFEEMAIANGVEPEAAQRGEYDRPAGLGTATPGDEGRTEAED